MQKVNIYRPDNTVQRGFVRVLGDIAVELSRNGWLTYQCFRRDFVSLYKQSFIGVWWALLFPLVSIGTFALLNRAGILDLGELEVPYTIYAVAGLAFWQLFSSGVVSGANALVKAGQMIVKVNFSRKSLVLASSFQCLVTFAVQFVLLLVLCLVGRFKPHALLLLAPLFMVPVLCLMLACSFMAALLNGVFRDIGHILSVLMSFLMLLTPVLYAPPTTGALAVITRVNPLYYLISVPRDVILTGRTTQLLPYGVVAFLSVILCVFSIMAFHMAESRVAERI